MVGVSMALAIAICVGGFTAIYAGLTPWLSDIVPIAPAASTQVASNNARSAPASDNNAEQPAIAPAEEAAPTSTPAPEAAPTATVAPVTDAFEPTHQINIPNGEFINLRPDPSTNNEAIRSLSPGTPLRYLDEETPTSDGVWMRFATEEGEEGWIREIDTEAYVP